MRSAIFKMNASPRPIAPAGGVTISPASSAPLKRARSFGATRCSKLASATTITSALGCSSMKARTASSNCARLGVTRPSVAKFEPSTTTRRRDDRIGLFLQPEDLLKIWVSRQRLIDRDARPRVQLLDANDGRGRGFGFVSTSDYLVRDFPRREYRSSDQ